MAADVRAEEEPRASARSCGVAAGIGDRGRIETYLELGKVTAAKRGLVTLVVAVTDAKLGRKGIGPVRVQLKNARIDILLQLIAVRLQAESKGRGRKGVLL